MILFVCTQCEDCVHWRKIVVYLLCMYVDAYRLGSSGKSMAGVETKIDDPNE